MSAQPDMAGIRQSIVAQGQVAKRAFEMADVIDLYTQLDHLGIAV